ncbi:2-hydroxyacid dehydrogenase [Saccharopolyspora spinosa]|uniref:Phosphoglycerate dehydrogenase-like enzyme n=1 Tax=Saccharopolyspora spinosa TaxID=60894 RepID=A0A2N3Y8I1_SACSN|nr:2-hydroxyacid dehydrogenase [Saccharopolyspora spinosa]PKW19171.1 phosphoglycerate dehydrogenase-like enzyme [Saccharopolyspora spinosa]
MRVAVTDENVWPWLRDSTALANQPIELEYLPGTDRAAVRDRLSGASACVGVFFDAELARAVGPDFRLLQVTAAGTDHIAIDELPTSVAVCNAYGHGRSIAEHVLMVLLAARRHLLWRDAELRQGRWRTRMVDPTAPVFRSLRDSTVGIIGFGHIGRSIAQLCRSVGMRPIAVRKSASSRDVSDPDAVWVAGMDALGDLLDESDVLVVACPLTDETRGLIAAPELKRLGSAATVVNVARGAVFNESDLYDALRQGTIANAALDVWTTPASADVVPPSPFPFAELDNVVMTPHFSATADDTYSERAEEVVENLVHLLDGTPLRNVVREASP